MLLFLSAPPQSTRGHGIASTLWFHLKASGLQALRAYRNLQSRELVRHPRSDALREAPIIAESRTALWSDAPTAEAPLILGKIENLRRAATRLDGVEVSAHDLFSFWRQVGKATRLRGFVPGRELREGCVIPAIGGGLCQLSNALYDVALQASFEIVERHRHSAIVAGSLAERDRDATVFWNYIDLRFRASFHYRIEVALDAKELIVRLRAYTTSASTRARQQVKQETRSRNSSLPQASCFSCETPCAKARNGRAPPVTAATAWLLDEAWPEFDAYLKLHRTGRDLLTIPIDGARWNKPNYRWHTHGFHRVKTSPIFALWRSMRVRRLCAQGAARQQALLDFDERLAQLYSRRLRAGHTHVVVAQSLLPHLWRSGALAGRTFDVLATRLPLHTLQARLDVAKQLHPESETLADFRAPEALCAAEIDAFLAADSVITPHAEIAAMFAHKARKLSWQWVTKPRRVRMRRYVVFPAATLGRKGAYELREAQRALNFPLMVLGATLEAKDFWKGCPVVFRDYRDDWLADTAIVVLPAFVESRPRALLQAIAAEVPIITTRACGVEGLPGVYLVPAASPAALIEKLRSLLPNQGSAGELRIPRATAIGR